MPELERLSGALDINIEDAVAYRMGVTYKIGGVAQDVTGYTAEFQIRSKTGSEDPLLSLTDASGITVGATTGKFDILITAAQAVFGNRMMVYDLVITPPGGRPLRLLRGSCKSWSRGN